MTTTTRSPGNASSWSLRAWRHDPPLRRFRWILAVLALVAAACGSEAADIAAEQASEPATDSVEEAEDPTTTVAEDPTTTVAEDPTTTVAEVEEVPEPGEVTLKGLGTSVALDFGEPAGKGEFQGMVAVGRAGEMGPLSSGILFMRPTGFAAFELRGIEGPTPFPDTLGNWFTYPEVNVSSQSETTVDGFDATVTDFAIERSDDANQDCGPPPQDQCIFLASTPDPEAARVIRVRTAQSARLWLVDQGEHLPLLILALANDGDEGFLDIAQAAVETVELGDPQPAPG